MNGYKYVYLFYYINIKIYNIELIINLFFKYYFSLLLWCFIFKVGSFNCWFCYGNILWRFR